MNIGERIKNLRLSKLMTQKELAQKLGISRSYVSRIEKAALEKIKYRMTRKQL